MVPMYETIKGVTSFFFYLRENENGRRFAYDLWCTIVEITN
jgi:hypothetical protein